VHDAPTSVDALLEGGLGDATCVVLGAPAELSASEADAAILAGVLQVQDAALRSRRAAPPHVAAVIRRPSSAKMLGSYLGCLGAELRGGRDGGLVLRAPELMHANDVKTAIIAQARAALRAHAAPLQLQGRVLALLTLTHAPVSLPIAQQQQARR
jgi:hypothetical protein